MNLPIRVVLAEDHPGVRASIRYLLERAPNIRVIAETPNGYEALLLAKRLVPDVLLLDIEMPGMNGIEVTQNLQELESPVRVLALSSHDQREYVVQVLQNGAWGYLAKEDAPNILVEAVQGISRGETGWFSNRIEAKLSESHKRSTR